MQIKIAESVICRPNTGLCLWLVAFSYAWMVHWSVLSGRTSKWNNRTNKKPWSKKKLKMVWKRVNKKNWLEIIAQDLFFKLAKSLANWKQNRNKGWLVSCIVLYFYNNVITFYHIAGGHNAHRGGNSSSPTSCIRNGYCSLDLASKNINRTINYCIYVCLLVHAFFFNLK